MLYNTKRGFTLIELLVVVLIIGILAAIAVPQYQLAVAKSRVSTILPLLKTLVKADEIRYLTSGEHVFNAEQLDIDIPAVCTAFTQNDGTAFPDPKYKCGNDFMVQFMSTSSNRSYANALYCPGHNNNVAQCRDNYEIGVYVYTSRDSTFPGQIKCDWKTTFGRKICKTLQTSDIG